MKLNDVILWLRDVENLACNAYSHAAQQVGLPQDLRDFLEILAEDESLHYHLMGSAAELIRKQGVSPDSAVKIDKKTDKRITAPLHQFSNKLERNCFNEDDILKSIVASESSEWNEIFMYVMHVCMEISKEFQYTAAAIQAHEERIENFLVEKNSELADEMHAFPRVWKNKVLIVEDDPSVRMLFQRVLSRYGKVFTAENGEVALHAVEQNFFNVILSDVKMPVMDGVTLFQRATEIDSRFASRFIFCTGYSSEAVEKIAEDYDVPILNKPMTIHALWNKVEQIISRPF